MDRRVRVKQDGSQRGQTCASLLPNFANAWLCILPGVGLCLIVTALAYALQAVEIAFAGRPWLEALVIAILLGVAIRSLWTPPLAWHAGVAFSAKTLLEIAVVLLGASISVDTVLAMGPALIAGIAIVVVVAIATSYAISRALGLPRRMAILVACGNSICGNSAIAAVAPVIGADGEDVAASIAFTAVLGVVVVLGLPLLVPLLNLSLTQYGVLAGLTVYAVPQVLAATLPIGALSNQVGAVVKLVRVLMLGPMVLLISLFASSLREASDELAPEVTAGDRTKPGRAAASPACAVVHRRISGRRRHARRRGTTERCASPHCGGRQRADDGFDGGARLGRGYQIRRDGGPASDRGGHLVARRSGNRQPGSDPIDRRGVSRQGDATSG